MCIVWGVLVGVWFCLQIYCYYTVFVMITSSIFQSKNYGIAFLYM